MLNLDGAKITDAGLKHLERLPSLRVLTLSDTQVSDAGLEHLKCLADLRLLDLRGTDVTDAGLQHLRGLPELSTLRLTGQSGGPWPHTPIIDFVIQYHDGDGYREIPQTKITNNESPDWHTRFEPVTTNRLRLTVTKTPGDLTRIWEWEVYHPPTKKK